MSINIYDSDFNLATVESARFSINGLKGGSAQALFYIRNDDINFYYENVTGILDLGGYEADGWMLKAIKGSLEPTEKDWSEVLNLETIVFDNIGSMGNGDDTTYYPFWVRVSVPKNSAIRRVSLSPITISALSLPA